MLKKRKEGLQVYRLPPCPAYDVEGMESWLTDMAKNGLLLNKNGFFAGVASFIRGNPQNLKYRLDAAQKSTSMWANDSGEPDQEAVALSEKYGWEYVSKRGDFYIYRSSETATRELNTDPDVQAIALNTVRKRQYTAVFQTLLLLIILPVLKLRGDLLIVMINIQTWFFLLGAFLIIWLLADSLAKAICLGKLRKKLHDDGILNHAKDWKKRIVWYHAKKALQIVLIIAWLSIFLHGWSASVLGEDKTQLADYHGEPPFATMADLAGDGEHITFGYGSNTVREWEDWLAPFSINWVENLTIKRTDGTVLGGGLYIDYHETINTWIAKSLALEYYRQDKRGKGFKQVEMPTLNVDYAVAYMDKIGFTTIVIREGNIVVHAKFFQTSSSYNMELEEWAQLMANSIKSK